MGSGEVGRRNKGLWRTFSVKSAEATSGGWAFSKSVWAMCLEVVMSGVVSFQVLEF